MPTIISGDGSADFNTPLPVAEGGTGASTSIGSGGVMLSGQTGSAPVFGARAWCVFDGTVAGTNAPTAGGNVTSVTRVSTGIYTINFATAMPDANYATVFIAGVSGASTSTFLVPATPQTTTSVTVGSVLPSTTAAQDTKVCSVAIFR